MLDFDSEAVIKVNNKLILFEESGSKDQISIQKHLLPEF